MTSISRAVGRKLWNSFIFHSFFFFFLFLWHVLIRCSVERVTRLFFKLVKDSIPIELKNYVMIIWVVFSYHTTGSDCSGKVEWTRYAQLLVTDKQQGHIGVNFINWNVIFILREITHCKLSCPVWTVKKVGFCRTCELESLVLKHLLEHFYMSLLKCLGSLYVQLTLETDQSFGSVLAVQPGEKKKRTLIWQIRIKIIYVRMYVYTYMHMYIHIYKD